MNKLFQRFGKLPKDLQKLVKEDMKTAFANRIKAMEKIAKKRV